MKVVLKSSHIEDACTDFQNTVLPGLFYTSDDCEGDLDVIYTIPENTQVQEWANGAKASGLIENLEILEA